MNVNLGGGGTSPLVLLVVVIFIVGIAYYVLIRTNWLKGIGEIGAVAGQLILVYVLVDPIPVHSGVPVMNVLLPVRKLVAT